MEDKRKKNVDHSKQIKGEIRDRHQELRNDVSSDDVKQTTSRERLFREEFERQEAAKHDSGEHSSVDESVDYEGYEGHEGTFEHYTHEHHEDEIINTGNKRVQQERREEEQQRDEKKQLDKKRAEERSKEEFYKAEGKPPVVQELQTEEESPAASESHAVEEGQMPEELSTTGEPKKGEDSQAAEELQTEEKSSVVSESHTVEEGQVPEELSTIGEPKKDEDSQAAEELQTEEKSPAVSESHTVEEGQMPEELSTTGEPKKGEDSQAPEEPSAARETENSQKEEKGEERLAAIAAGVSVATPEDARTRSDEMLANVRSTEIEVVELIDTSRLQASIDAHNKTSQEYAEKAELAASRAKSADSDVVRAQFEEQAHSLNYQAALESEHASYEALEQARRNGSSEIDVQALESKYEASKIRTKAAAEPVAQRQIDRETARQREDAARRSRKKDKEEKEEKDGSIAEMVLLGAATSTLEAIEGDGPHLMSSSAHTMISGRYTVKSIRTLAKGVTAARTETRREIADIIAQRNKDLVELEAKVKRIKTQMDAGLIQEARGKEHLRALQQRRQQIMHQAKVKTRKTKLRMFKKHGVKLAGKGLMVASSTMAFAGAGSKATRGGGPGGVGNMFTSSNTEQSQTELKTGDGAMKALNPLNVYRGAQTIHNAPKTISRLVKRGRSIMGAPHNVAHTIKTARNTVRTVQIMLSGANPAAALMQAAKAFAENFRASMGKKINDLMNTLPSMSFGKLFQAGTSLGLVVVMIAGLFGGVAKDDEVPAKMPVTPWGLAIAIVGTAASIAIPTAILLSSLSSASAISPATLATADGDGEISALTYENASEDEMIQWQLDAIRAYMKSTISEERLEEYDAMVNDDGTNRKEVEEAKQKYIRQNKRDPLGILSIDSAALKAILKEVDEKDNKGLHEIDTCDHVYHKFGSTFSVAMADGKTKNVALSYDSVKKEVEKIKEQRYCVDEGLALIYEKFQQPWNEAIEWGNGNPYPYDGRSVTITPSGPSEIDTLNIITAAAFMNHDEKGTPIWKWADESRFLFWTWETKSQVWEKLERLLSETPQNGGPTFGGNLVTYDYYEYVTHYHNRYWVEATEDEAAHWEYTDTYIQTRAYSVVYRMLDDSNEYTIWEKSGNYLSLKSSGQRTITYPVYISNYQPSKYETKFAVVKFKDFPLARTYPSDMGTNIDGRSKNTDSETDRFPMVYYNDVGVQQIKASREGPKFQKTDLSDTSNAGDVDLSDPESFEAGAEDEYELYYENDLIDALKHRDKIYEFHSSYLDDPRTTFIPGGFNEGYVTDVAGGGGGGSSGTPNPQSSGNTNPNGLRGTDALKPDYDHMKYYPNYQTGYKKPGTTWKSPSLTPSDVESYLAKAARSNGKPLTAKQEQLLRNAMSYVGVVPYYWGGYWGNQGNADGTGHYGAAATAIDGLDCAGFVRTIWHYLQPAVEIPSGCKNQENSGKMTRISMSEMKPGDPVYRDGHVMTFLYSENGVNYYIGAASTASGCVIAQDSSLSRAWRLNAADW